MVGPLIPPREGDPSAVRRGELVSGLAERAPETFFSAPNGRHQAGRQRGLGNCGCPSPGSSGRSPGRPVSGRAALQSSPSPWLVWFQNRRSKERRMKQLSALGARRHAFFRSPRRMRPLGGRLDESEMLGSTPYTYYGDYQGDYYGPGGNYDFFPHGPPSQAQSPADSSYIPTSGAGSTPLGALEPPLPGHHASENQRYTDMISHPDTPSPEPGLPGALHPISGEVFSGGPSPPFSMSNYSGGPLSHPNQELNETAVW